MNHSPYKHVPTFSQVHGYQEIPGPPQLEQISGQARNNLWGALWRRISSTAIGRSGRQRILGLRWRAVLAAIHQGLLGQPLDDFVLDLDWWRHECRRILLHDPFHGCFDFLETIIRHPECPSEFTEEIKEIFLCQLAYRIDTTSIPRILPAASEQEGDALLQAIQDLEGGGLGGAAVHLRQSGERIQGQDWAGSVRASIDAVESVTKQVVPGNPGTLGKALTVLERQEGLHGALKKGFSALYGYTSDEPGVRHSLLEDESQVTRDEAIFMIGACAAFCSYLWRKFGSGSTH